LSNRKLTYYIAASLDGFIAAPDGAFDAFPMPSDVRAEMLETRPETVPTAYREPAGIADAPNRCYDTVLMGKGTYLVPFDNGDPNPYAHLRQCVFSRSLEPNEHVEVVASDPAEFVRGLKTEAGLDIWLCGGGLLAGALIGEIDEIVVKRYPVLFGGGIPMFAGAYAPTGFTLAEHRTYDSGAAVHTYRKA
jgi:dihydrofolate reductase